MEVGAAVWSDMKIGRSDFDLTLTEGKAEAKLKSVTLYGGSGHGTVTIDARKGTPEMTVDATLSGIDAAPFLWDLADLTIVRGASVFVSVTTFAVSFFNGEAERRCSAIAMSCCPMDVSREVIATYRASAPPTAAYASR